MSKFLVIEAWPSLDSASLVMDPDTGKVKSWDTRGDAQIEADDCQNGVVVEITGGY